MGNLSKTFGKLTIPLLVLLAICFSALPAQAKYGGGTGEPNDPYLIYNANQMNAIGTHPDDFDKHFKLIADIDLSGFPGTAFNIIGSYDNPFTGVFDGNGHTISNFSYTSTEGDNIGLFGCIDGPDAEIKDLGLIAPDVDGGTGDCLGSLVGYVKNGTITACYAEDGSVSGNYGGDLDYTFYPISPNLRNISATGTSVTLSDDQVSNAIHLPFNFNFYDRWVSEVYISSNGFITFLSGWDSGCCSGRPLPSPGSPDGLIAGFWSDLYPPGGGTIRYKTLGRVGSRQFVIGFYQVPHCCGSGPDYYPVTFEIILHEGTNNIELQYGSAPAGFRIHSAGIENFDGTDGLQVAYGNVSFDNEAFLIVAFSGSRNVGALVGQNEGTIFNSYSTSDVSGVDGIGGLVGGSSGPISNCYSTGSVSGDYRTGGLAGYNDGGEVTGSFWDIQTSGQYGSAGGTGKTTAQMQDPNTFMDAGWNFVGKPDGPSNIWAEPAGGGYPILWWQLSPLPDLPTFSGGTGTADDPYLISTAAELNSISYNPRLMQAHFKLIDDIDLTGVDFYIMGSRDYPYSGVFDGNDHTISNFSYTSTGTSHIALFGYVRGVIKDLGLLDHNVDAPTADYVGSLVARLSSGTITNSYATGSISGSDYVGGLVGDNYGTITNCYSNCSISGANDIGGLVGWNYDGAISNCYAEGDASGNQYVGGLVGYNYEGTITDCYATGEVAGSEMMIGGLMGLNEWGTVTNCYATGEVTGPGMIVGGLVGYNVVGTITNSYATGSVSGIIYVGGLAGASGGTISFCYSQGGSASGDQFVGGFMGYNMEIISNCYSTYSVSGTTYVGGLVGYNSGPITNCYSEGDVSGYENVGGLVGYNQSVASIFLDHTLSPIPTNLRRITGTAVPLGWYEMSGAIPLPFNFNFYDTDFSELFISSNGYITFLSGQYSSSARPLPNPNPYDPHGLIAGFWTYMDPSVGGTIRYQTLGSEGSRQFVIGFYNVPYCCEPGYYPATFEIILHEGTNNIELQYGSTPSLSLTSVGIENFDGTDGLQVAYGYDVSLNYEGFLITPEGPVERIGAISRCYSTGSVSGTTNVGGLLGDNVGTVYLSFWDTETSGQTDSQGGTGLPTAEMQMAGTFTDAKWDFNTPVWTIDEGVDYPRLLWEEKYGGGTGSRNDPYLIYTADQLNTIGLIPCHLDKHFKLMADIDLAGLTGTDFNIIGERYYDYGWVENPFTGVFDGSGKKISNFSYTSTDTDYGGIFGYVTGEIKDLGLIAPDVDAGTESWGVGSLIGWNAGTITNCYVEGGSVAGRGYVGGLVGYNDGTITNCYSTASVWGQYWVGGLVGSNWGGTTANCYASGDVSGDRWVGGLVGWNEYGRIYDSFWDIETSGQTTSAGGTGKTTAQMQMQVTFTDAGWDFTTPIWTIDEGVDYPRLWWEFVPVLHAEPQVTLGNSNRISWEPVVGNVEYYAECGEDVNFTNIVYNSGWITEISCEFTGLQLGKRYWYSVKARNSAGTETNWSNVESSLQVTLADAVEMMLDTESLKNEKMKNALLDKIDAALEMIEDGLYEDALSKLEHDILAKMNGCVETGEPDKNDWIITCEEQSTLYPLVIETIEYVEGLVE